MENITTIFFDVGGVLLTNGWDHAAREKAANHFDYDHEESEARHQQLAQSFECGQLGLEETVFFRSRPFRRIDFIRFMESQSQGHKEALAVLDRLAASGKYRLATINNESLPLNLYRIRTFGLGKYFSVFFSSCFLGVKKPDCAIFQKVLHITQLSGEKCLFIDDREENVIAARQCKLRATQLLQPNHLSQILASHDITAPKLL